MSVQLLLYTLINDIIKHVEMIKLPDRLTAKTADGILTSSKEVEYFNGDGQNRPNTVAEALDNVVGSIDDKDNAKNITYSALKSLRDNSQLVPGTFYRITDYVTTTVSANTQSAGHQFDVIVRADEVNKLNENAYAAKHAGDTYFANSNLAAWKLKYTIDNICWSSCDLIEHIVIDAGGGHLVNANYDGTQIINGPKFFKWNLTESVYGYSVIYSTSKNVGESVYLDIGGSLYKIFTIYDYVEASLGDGKGTILWLKDEYDNECPYDFKNIQYKVGAKSQSGTVADVFYYTFSVATGTNDASVTDHSLNGNYCYGNKIGKYITNTGASLNINVFRNTSVLTDCYFNTFVTNCKSNTFGNGCSANTFGNGCSANTFGSNCYMNTFWNECHDNTFGDSCAYNTFVTNCSYNTFGNSFYSNLFGEECRFNTFGDGCYHNTFGNNCGTNTFGDSCGYNTFGTNCYYIKFGTSSATKSFCENIIVENGNRYLYIDCSATTSPSAYFQNIKIAQGVNNTSTYKTITHATAGDTFQTIYKPINSKEVSV